LNADPKEDKEMEAAKEVAPEEEREVVEKRSHCTRSKGHSHTPDADELRAVSML
jgi:hypothetical protein